MGRWTNEDLAQVLADNPALRVHRENSPLAGKEPVRVATRGSDKPQTARIAQNEASERLPALSFTVPGPPTAKPRQTKRDKWAKRPCVLRYREWADLARLEAKRALGRQLKGLALGSYARIQIVAFLPIPASWPKSRKLAMKGRAHQSKPDADNIVKACCDALYPTRDEQIYDIHITKRWDDGNGARTVITLW